MRLWPLFAAIATTLLLVAAPTARAAGSPDLTAEISSESVLYGDHAHVTVTASNPSGPYGYNLSFRVVLPAGVSYAGGASVAPRQIANQPAANQTTLIFANVSDLSPGSKQQLGFNLAYNQSAYDAGATFNVGAQAFANSDPRYVPKFLATGAPDGPRADSYTGYSAAVSGTQTLTAIRVTKTEPSPEGEILRGVHDHQTDYTLKVTNNGVNPTTGVTLDDYLPAGLEFLGCGGAGADHTTNAPTNPGSSEEYPGSGPITVATLAGCTAPLTVATENVDPDGPVGPLPTGVYTHVTWPVGTLAAGDARTFTYRAAVPLRANTLTFTGAQPTPASLGQATNLDNNSGPEVTDETDLRNYAHVAGTYNGATPVSDATTLTRTAEDWVVRKAASSGTLAQGALTTWTLTFQTSEYKFVDDATVTDTLPNGLCPLGATNLAHNADADDAECDPVGGQTPSRPYTSATENADGTWTLQWDESTFSQLAHTDVNDTFTLTFPTRTRKRYQSNYEPTTPDPHARRDHEHRDARAPACTARTAARSSTPARPARSPVTAVISKQIAASGTDCATATYVGTVPHYHPGDRICWKLRVDFPGRARHQPAGRGRLPAAERQLRERQRGPDRREQRQRHDRRERRGRRPAPLDRDRWHRPHRRARVRAHDLDDRPAARHAGRRRHRRQPAEVLLDQHRGRLRAAARGGELRARHARADADQGRRRRSSAAARRSTARTARTSTTGTVVGGDEVTYRIDVTNSGAQDAEQRRRVGPAARRVSVLDRGDRDQRLRRLRRPPTASSGRSRRSPRGPPRRSPTPRPCRTRSAPRGRSTTTRAFAPSRARRTSARFYDYRPASNIDGDRRDARQRAGGRRLQPRDSARRGGRQVRHHERHRVRQHGGRRRRSARRSPTPSRRRSPRGRSSAAPSR